MGISIHVMVTQVRAYGHTPLRLVDLPGRLCEHNHSCFFGIVEQQTNKVGSKDEPTDYDCFGIVKKHFYKGEFIYRAHD